MIFFSDLLQQLKSDSIALHEAISAENYILALSIEEQRFQTIENLKVLQISPDERSLLTAITQQILKDEIAHRSFVLQEKDKVEQELTSLITKKKAKNAYNSKNKRK